ncbi:Gfo/Idh/MocA family protein [Microbacterium sp. 22242]|uniref:Gfo/Idh/MocA family protein n=1 Tax=Microbacterium sp. 22242 TaxID=3453896 RepID=UPI003F83D521
MGGRPARVALIGAHGFGLVHRQNLDRLQGRGRATLVAVAEPSPLEPGELPAGVRAYRDADALLAGESDLDVVIVCTPLHTHFDLAVKALATGADLYLEKPPVTSLEQFDRLRAAAADADRLVQVGFQSLGSHALPWLRSAIDGGALGDIRAITAAGLWTRNRAYFARSRWAGKRTLDGVDVVDGVATNALSHAVITALNVAGARRSSDVSRIEVDLHRANPTESDDTTVVRASLPGAAADVTCALTLCGPGEAEPFVTVHGSEATATFFYVRDEVRVDAGDSSRTTRFERTDLLENLLDARDGRASLLSALDDTEAYMGVLETVRTSAPPHPIAAEFVDRVGTGGEERIVIRGIEEAVLRAVAAQATFTELGLPWAVDPDRRAETIAADGPTPDE